jgi:histone acetyltransferase (RNA polymerase elongator complex component)
MALLVIPIFISHQGCPHRCIFCDQYTITGHSGMEGRPVTPASVKMTIEQWLNRPRKENDGGVQVAFYGGSFTGLSLQRQRELLRSVAPYIEDGQVDSIRISTRPDYIDAATILLLKEYSVGIVELGIQSLHQDVLEASIRGHSVQQSEDAISLLKKNNFTVGAQIMCGLPGDTTSRQIATVKRVAALAPDFVRIYPVLVIRGSGLEKIYRNNTYKPLSLSKAIALSCRMKSLFDQHGIKVVRMGLQPSRELEDKVLAGPYHPSFGELVISRTLFRKSRKILRRINTAPPKCLSIAAADESAFRGRNNVSIKRLAALGLLDGIELVFDKDQPRNHVAAIYDNCENSQ